MGEDRRFRSRRLQRVGILLGLSLAACATPPPTPVPLPTPEERRAAVAAGYELPEVRSAAELLPPELLAGPHHVVVDAVYTDRFTDVFTIESEFGTFSADGEDVLRQRIAEVEALAVLEDMSTTKEFASAAGKALASPFVATWNVITNPVDTVLGIPKSAWEKVRRTSDLARSDRGELEDSAFVEFIGFERKKRQIAAELGVDPYTSNRVLQRELNRFAWAAYAGGLPSMFVPFKERPEPEPDAAEEADEQQRLRRILRQYSPEDLNRLNRIELAVMGVPEEMGKAFIEHPWYSPRYETALVENLAALDLTEDRRTFIELALTADSERAAHFYQRTAALMRRYNDRVDRIDRIVAVDGAVTGLARDGTLVVPLPADYAIWSADTAALADSVVGEAPPEIEVRETRLVLSGSLSPKARSEIEARGVAVVENAFDAWEPPAEPEPTDPPEAGD